MVQVVMFHSAYGLRQAEAGAAARLRAAGHDVITPDL
jgi:dienelactone hydrolase